MNPTLIYDAATMSTAPQATLNITLLLAALALARWAWCRWKRQAGDVLLRFFGVGTLIFAAVAAGTQYELKLIADAKAVRVVEGPLHRLWEDRTLRAGSKNEYAKWQGFRIAETPFVYCVNVQGNHFNNSGPRRIELREGLQLRVHYLEEGEGSDMQRHIVRVELLS